MRTIKKLRKESGLSRKAFAEKIYATPEELKDWERGRRNTPEWCLYMATEYVKGVKAKKKTK